MATLKNTSVNSITQLPVGTTSQRPANLIGGSLRFNSEIGSPEVLAESWSKLPGPRTQFEDFGRGFDSDWSTPNFSIYSDGDDGWSGPDSAGSKNSGTIDATWTPYILNGGARMTRFSFRWYEQSNQTGHAVYPLDTNGDWPFAACNENPQWYLVDNSGDTQIFGGNGYNRWIFYDFVFDYESGTYDYFMRDESSGTTRSGTRNLRSTNGIITQIKFSGTAPQGRGGSGSWVVFDSLSITVE